MSMFGSSALIGNGGGKPTVIQDFTGSGTWFCCPGVKLVQVITIAGGGGGGGASDTTTSGCASFYLSGGGGGQGGGISMSCYLGPQVGASGPVTVGSGGAGGSNGGNGTSGGDSIWCSLPGICVASIGGRFGGGNGSVKNGSASGGFGCGTGNYKNGNTGGGAGSGNGTGGSNSIADTTRGGGGGGSAIYCNVIPVSCTFCSAGSASTASNFTSPQTCIDLSSYGCGGRGGNGSVDSNRATAGLSGSGGLVRVIQYF